MRLWTDIFGAGTTTETEKDREIGRLRRELEATRGYLQTAVEEHEAAKEEMKSANEEALSANEEFLSTNEELETAKEELQSANEELGVTNQELRDRNRALNDLNDELQKSRSYLDAIIDTLREPLLVLDGDLVVQKANREFYETFQVQPEETLQRHIYELGEGQWNIPGLRTLLEKVLPENTSFRDFEVSHDFLANGNKTLLLNARRVSGNDRRAEMILLAIEDVTDRHISQIKLVEADQRKNNFLATLAHELRNPLAPILTVSSLLRREAKGTDLKHLDMIERQIQKLVRLVDALVDIARIEHDRIDLKLESVDLGTLVEQTIEASRPQFDARQHQLLTDLPSDPVRVMADPIRLEQIVTNLLSNAAKYSESGGEIWVAVEKRDLEALITVRDNGIGIAPELLPQLFEMFFQVDHSLARSAGGLGIGLSVAKSLVELHGGRLEGHSEGLGKGSEFIVRIPLMTSLESASNPPGEILHFTAPISTTHKVLIVDDNADTAEAMANFAQSFGHEVAVARDGPAALELVKDFHPDLALIDIGLPQMNGYELARRLRMLPAMSGVPLVAITGYAREEDRRTSNEAGFNLHLVKPVGPARLKELLDTLG